MAKLIPGKKYRYTETAHKAAATYGAPNRFNDIFLILNHEVFHEAETRRVYWRYIVFSLRFCALRWVKADNAEILLEPITE
jgi:hypothetical protein